MSHVAADGMGRFLSGCFGEPVTVGDFERSSAGARRINVLFDASSKDGSRTWSLVATILPTSEIEINPIAAEAAVRAVAEDGGVPVPHVYATCTDPSFIGAPFFVSQRVEGETIPRRVLRLVQAEQTGDRVAGQLGEALGRLHAIDPALAPAGLVSDEGVNPAELALAEVDVAVTALLPARPAFGLALRWLERRVPDPPPRRTIVHTDARNGNLIVGPEGLRGLLDWEGTRRFGDPMQDIAWPAVRMWRFGEDAREIGGLAGREPYVAGYESAGGRFDPERFLWWKVLGTARWGAGLAKQAADHREGRFRDVVMMASGRRVLEMEWDLLMLLRPALDRAVPASTSTPDQ